ncbi:MAG TPA: type II secretion system protein [Phycisphaerae bacterium]|nr:type II secretion system protein [Phycisphaerae bacterium]
MSVQCDRQSVRGKLAGPRAFTLIEVLVVVAIIALLVSILLPSLKQARYQARVVACQGRLHDLGNAFQMYSNVYNGYFPLTMGSTEDNFSCLWRAKMLPSTEILICPATRNVVRGETLEFAKHDDTESQSDLYYVASGPEDSNGGHSYEYNGCYNSDKGFSMSRAPKKSTTFIYPPHEMMLVHDADNERTDQPDPAFGCRPIAMNDSREGGNNCPQAWDNHGQAGMNMMFGDGHARFTKKTTGKVLDMREARDGTLPDPKPSVNAEIETIWLKSQFPWRYRRR